MVGLTEVITLQNHAIQYFRTTVRNTWGPLSVTKNQSISMCPVENTVDDSPRVQDLPHIILTSSQNGEHSAAITVILMGLRHFPALERPPY